MAHKHAELMMQYAQDAIEADKPWERWQVRVNKHWHDLYENPQWIAALEYRRKTLTSREEKTTMNNALKELEQIAQRLDAYMHEHGNSAALVTAAEAIADELDERDVTITRVQITLQVDVKHNTMLDTETIYEEAVSHACYTNDLVTDIFTLEENIDVDPDFNVDLS